MLIDFDNVRLEPRQPLRTQADVELSIEELLDSLCYVLPSFLPDIDEVDIRLYGGWMSEEGVYSNVGDWMLKALPDVRGRRKGIIFRPMLITAAACYVHGNFFGLLRINERGRRYQKMVDCLIAIDAVYIARNDDVPLAIVSDDDDLVPALVAASLETSNIISLIRLRKPGHALNDTLLRKLKVSILALGR